MKIPKLFKKAAAFVMAAVTALSIMPATAFAAGDIGTISFSHTYDSNGNAMRYNSSANIGGYTAGGTGNYKYRPAASPTAHTFLRCFLLLLYCSFPLPLLFRMNGHTNHDCVSSTSENCGIFPKPLDRIRKFE